MEQLLYSLLGLMPFFLHFSAALPLDDAAVTNIPAPSPSLDDDDESIFALLFILTTALVFMGGFLLAIILLIKIIIEKLTFRAVQLNNLIPGSLDDEFEIEERIKELSPNEQNLYRSGQEYLKQNPPYLVELSLSEHMIIQEKGVEAWEFIPDPNLNPEAIFVVNKTELNFTNFDYQCSIQTNLPIPKINDVYYYEMKVFILDSPEDTVISAGLSTRPYPYFRLPGRHLYSIAYDSTGSRRYSNSFKISEAESSVFPKLIQGDVIGIGYRVRSGTIFFTRNGRKLSEKTVGGHIKGMRLNNLYPTIGANNPCSVHVNIGQAGYVFIEANIKKWGYAPKEGNRPPLPSYNYSSNDLLLESSNEDDESISPPDFFRDVGYESSSSHGSISEDYTLNTIDGLPTEPPLYISDEDEELDDDRLLHENTVRNQFMTQEENESLTANIDESPTVTSTATTTVANVVEIDDDDDKSMDLNDESNDTANNITQSTMGFEGTDDQTQEEQRVAVVVDNVLETEYEASMLISQEMESRDDSSVDDPLGSD